MHHHLHPAIASARTADLHDDASRATPGSTRRRAERRLRPLLGNCVPLDSYPRLCGLPVTVERLELHMQEDAR